jgi:hypothetical protein
VTTLKLDFDSDAETFVPGGAPNVLVTRWPFVCQIFRLREVNRTLDRSTHDGIHASIEVEETLTATAIVALQAILGSDWKRETYNLMRALVVDQAPDFWQPRWNVLYSAKLEGGGSVLNEEALGLNRRPTIKASLFPGKNLIPLTISDVDNAEFDNRGEARATLALTFAEMPDHVYYPNKTSLIRLVKVLGLDEIKWINKKIPLIRVRVNNPQTDRMVDALHVAEPESEAWDIVNDAGKAIKSKK